MSSKPEWCDRKIMPKLDSLMAVRIKNVIYCKRHLKSDIKLSVVIRIKKQNRNYD